MTTIKQMVARGHNGHGIVLRRMLESGTYGRPQDSWSDIRGFSVCYKTLVRWGCIEKQQVTDLGKELLKALEDAGKTSKPL